VIVLGSFARAGDVFVTDVKVLDVQSKELLKSASAKGTGVGSILDSQIDELGKEISKGVGLSERLIVAAGSRPIASVTTSSMDAYDYFLRGKEAYQKFYYTDALRDLEKAVALDSTFAVAWLYLARTQEQVREMNARDASYERAMALSASASEKDRLYIEASYANTIDNNDGRSRALLTELVTKYPKEKEALVQLGRYYRDMKMFEDAEDAFLRAIELDPNYGEPLNEIAYLYAAMEDYERAITYFERYAATYPNDANPFDSMGEMYFRMGQLDEAIAMYERALKVRPDFGSERGMGYVVAFREDYAGAIRLTRQFMTAASSPGMRVSGEFILSYYYLYGCRWQAAIEAIGRVEKAFERMGFHRGIAGTRWLESWVRYEMGDYKRTLECVNESIAIASSVKRQDSWLLTVSETMKGLVDVKEGRLDEAKARLALIEAEVPKIAVEDPLYWESSVYVSALFRAEILLAEGEVDRCIEVCDTLPLPGPPPMGQAALFFYNFPAERDVLARAYVAKGALDAAIAEYERLVTFDPASNDRRLVYPLFHYRLARLYEEKGHPDKAVRQYERFLEIIGEGDPALSEAADARARLAKRD
jgi:tetratricopeptide (TPR) repeat protein